jgi:small-conductance mechanosensitive channel
MSINCPFCHNDISYEDYLKHIEEEHPEIVGKGEHVTPNPAIPSQYQKPKQWLRTPENLKQTYITILDRFKNEESKSIKEYSELLLKINESIAAIQQANIPALDVTLIILQDAQRKINRIIQEEQIHLDALNAIREEFTTIPSLPTIELKVYEIDYKEKDTHKTIKGKQFTRKEIAEFYQEKPYEQIIAIRAIK